MHQPEMRVQHAAHSATEAQVMTEPRDLLVVLAAFAAGVIVGGAWVYGVTVEAVEEWVRENLK